MTDIARARERLEQACRHAEEEYPKLAAPDGTVAVPFTDLRALLSTVPEPRATFPTDRARARLRDELEKIVAEDELCHGYPRRLVDRILDRLISAESAAPGYNQTTAEWLQQVKRGEV